MKAFKNCLAAAVVLFVAGCGDPVSPPLPPLLQGATSGGGGNYLCNGDPTGRRHGPEETAHSPEIVARLQKAFPTGSSTAKLIESLKEQGFAFHGPCSSDNVAYASFSQAGGNGITAMAASAEVYWKDDGKGHLVWTTGNISFLGL
jgi:hypothetical protein